MPFTYDPEVAEAMAPMIAAAAATTPPEPGDWKARRDAVDILFATIGAGGGVPDDVTVTHAETTSADGTTVPLRVYTPEGALPAVVLYVHGGGMIAGTVAGYEPLVANYAAATRITFVAVDYRLAPEHPFPAAVEDAYAAAVWTAGRAGELGADPRRVAVMGDSAGGGIAAGVALMARDRGTPALAYQLLVYPMLDDTTTIPDDDLAPLATWTYEDNLTGWDALLGEAARGPEVSPYAAPARAPELAGVAPAFIDVGIIDIFRDEDIAYASRLMTAGVPTELHVYPGVPHGFDAFAPTTAVARRAVAERVRALVDLATR